jgi:alcohol dehydrogenase class IV
MLKNGVQSVRTLRCTPFFGAKPLICFDGGYEEPMGFEFATAARVVFGNGCLSRLGELAAPFGKRVLLVGGAGVECFKHARQLIGEGGFQVVISQVPGEPTLDLVRAGTNLARSSECEFVVAIGGGSAIDTGKAIAALAANAGDVLDYLEVIGQARALERPGLPFIAIPTTAGTGSEVTRNAVIGSPAHGVKASLRSPAMLAKVALVDPELTYTLPPNQTAACGMDALTQLIEPFTCNQPSPIVDALCVDGIRLAARNLATAYQDGKNPLAREAMSLASLYGGMALANARLGAVHGFAAPIGGARPAPHGAVCARMLPVVMEVNIKSLREREPNSPCIERYRQVARLVTGDGLAEPEAGVHWIYNLREQLMIPPLSSYGFTQGDIADLVEKASQASSIKGNPLKLTRQEMEHILLQSL